jgi:biotin carboxylase
MTLTLSRAQPGVALPPPAGPIAVVDPYSTGRLLAAELHKRGHQAVAVVPEKTLPIQHAESFRLQDYLAAITHRGRDDETRAILRSLGVTTVIAGCETGVDLADRLGASLAVDGCARLHNNPETTSLRRDKGRMMSALAAAGLGFARTGRAGTAAEACKIAAEIGYPVVVKPPGSAAADNVRLCHTDAEVAATWHDATGGPDQLGQVNDAALVQEYVTGQQYVANTVSVPGQDRPHNWVHEVWRDDRAVTKDGHIIFGRMTLLPADAPDAAAVIAYTVEALRAVGMESGATHSEIIVASRGPVLIDLNPRLSGMIDPAAGLESTGADAVSLTVDALTDPAGFAARHHGDYTRRRYTVQIWLAAPGAAVIEPAALRRLLNLPTVFAAVGQVYPKAPVTRTIDLGTCPGMIYLIGDEAAVERDATTIRALEQGGLYR